ncbi:MAG: FAD-dependent oxidoreductase [Henriciella sp.]
MSDRLVIVGASHAAAQCCISARQGGWEGPIIVIGDENELPYHRPPLSKDLLSGQKAIDDILIRPQAAYEKADIELRLGVRVIDINPDAKTIGTDARETIAYDKLVLATGARVRHLPVPGTDAEGVYYLRDARDVSAIQGEATAGKKAVIIGGGYIGLETAASLKKLGLDVTVLEAMPRILQRVTAPELSSFYKRVHTEEGVTILEGVSASAIEKTETGLQVQTSCAKQYDCDLVIIGIGVIPNTELATEAGLKVGNGVEVNSFCQTSNPDIYAIGDVTWHHNPIYDCNLRLESVPNATEQAKTAAAHINGADKPYNSLPWFWSDQFDLKLQIAGLSAGFDEIIIRGDAKTSRSFAAFYFDGDRLLAVDAVNRPREFMFARQALGKGAKIDKAKLAEDGSDLKACLLG